TELFQETNYKSVTEFKEYRQLQEFYVNRIARKVDEGLLGKWILGLSQGKFFTPVPAVEDLPVEEHPIETEHFYVDLETVKKDTEYELFFIRKEDGSRFFSPRLLRNIKLVCDFGEYFGETKKEDPLSDVKIWYDRIVYASARNILKSLNSKIDHFFKEIYAL